MSNPYIVLETGNLAGCYRIVVDDRDGYRDRFLFEFRGEDAMGQTSWQKVPRDNADELVSMLRSIATELDHLKRAEEAGPPPDDYQDMPQGDRS